ncbi:MAG: protein kinase [Polyangiaceae bacterium]|nr:protein kinase [Polyangiaceae bacterium]
MSRAEDDDDDQRCGSVVDDKYRIERLIGRGGMGAVYEATNIAIGKRVALKFLDRDAAKDADAVARFQREAEAAGVVESAHIVHIFDSGTSADGRPFLVMELLSGEDLRAYLRREGRMPVADAIHVIGQVLRALARAHVAGIVHRDLKPDNVFLCRRDDDAMFVKIVDFGISKITRREITADTLTHKGMVLGTAFYMSPEQAQAHRDIDGRSDLFSVGAILFEMLAGRPPHQGTVYEAVLIDICTKDAPEIRSLVPEVPEALAQVIARALRRERLARFQDANDFYDALAVASPGLLRTGGLGAPRARLSSGADSAAGEPRVITAEGTAVRPSAPSDARAQTRRTLVAVVVAAAAAFVLTALVMTRRTGHADPEAGAATARPAAVPTASALESAAPAVSTSPSTDAGAAPPKPGRPVRPSGKPVPSAPTEPVKPSPAGVATGLTLDTKGP